MEVALGGGRDADVLVVIHVETLQQQLLLLVRKLVQVQVGHELLRVAHHQGLVVDDALLHAEFVQGEAARLVEDQQVQGADRLERPTPFTMMF